MSNKGLCDPWPAKCRSSQYGQLCIALRQIVRILVHPFRLPIFERGAPVSAKPGELNSPVDEKSLDPEDWEEFRRLGHKAFDDMLEYSEVCG